MSEWLASDRECLLDLIAEALSGPCFCDDHTIRHDAELVVRALEACNDDWCFAGTHIDGVGAMLDDYEPSHQHTAEASESCPYCGDLDPQQFDGDDRG